MILADKVALVTGASTGIGRATIHKFMQEGAIVYGVGASSDEIMSITGDFTFIECDPTSEESVKQVCCEVREKIGKLDILVTVAEKMFHGSVLEVNASIIEEANRYICLAPMLFTKYCYGMLKESTNGSIAYNIPAAALMMDKNFLNSIYNVAIINYTRQCCSKLSPVRVNSILFGYMEDHLLTAEEISERSVPEKLAKIPAGRLGDSIEVASVSAFLASDKARYITGSTYTADGGAFTAFSRSMGNNGV